jgi:hypothetical protein
MLLDSEEGLKEAASVTLIALESIPRPLEPPALAGKAR